MKELVFVENEVVDGYFFPDDGHEVRIVLQVEVSLLVLFLHEVADAEVVLQFLLAVDPVFEEGLEVREELFFLQFIWVDYSRLGEDGVEVLLQGVE
jgi:hypothetical protein